MPLSRSVMFRSDSVYAVLLRTEECKLVVLVVISPHGRLGDGPGPHWVSWWW